MRNELIKPRRKDLSARNSMPELWRCQAKYVARGGKRRCERLEIRNRWVRVGGSARRRSGLCINSRVGREVEDNRNPTVREGAKS